MQDWEDGKWYLHCKEVVLHRVMYPKMHANGFKKKKNFFDSGEEGTVIKLRPEKKELR